MIALYILLGLAGFIALLLIIALFVKKEYYIEEEVIINKPKKTVFDYVKIIRNQELYSKWVMTDPLMKKTFTGTDGTVGFIYGWNGNNKAGEGEQEITKIVDGERIEMEIRFVRPFVSVADVHMQTTVVSDNQTKVIWGIAGVSKYPLNLTNVFMGGLLRKDMAISLANLKEILERK